MRHCPRAMQIGGWRDNGDGDEDSEEMGEGAAAGYQQVNKIV